MAKVAAGILLFRRSGARLEVLVVHPGGPLWATKDHGAWTIPKGEPADREDLLDAARREFGEETGGDASGHAVALGNVTQANKKVVHAWAVEGDFDPATLRSNTFQLEWPPRSGRFVEAPEIDRAAWLDLDAARVKLNPAQVVFLDRLRALLV